MLNKFWNNKSKLIKNLELMRGKLQERRPFRRLVKNSFIVNIEKQLK